MTDSAIKSSAKATEHSVLTLSETSGKRFSAEIEKLRIAKTSGPGDRVVLVLGLVLAFAGLAVALLCYAQATGFNDVRDQIQLIILALVGVGLTVLGTGLYVASFITRFLRWWMLRLLYEQRERV